MLRNSPYMLLIVATCIWGGNFVVGKMLVVHMPPITMAMLRWAIALLFLLPFFGKAAWQNRTVYARRWKIVVFLALTGVAGFNTLTYIAVQYTGSINASLMNAATPILVLILTWLILKETLAWAALPGIAVSMAGVLWIISRGSLQSLLELSFNAGDLWMLLAVFCWALYSVGMKKVMGQFPPSQLLFVQIVIALAALIPLSVMELSVTNTPVEWSPGLIGGLLYIGIFASIVAFLSWNRAIGLAGPQRCAGFLNLIPLFSALFATSFTSESIHMYHLLGAMLIIAGVYAASRMTRKPGALPQEGR